jgi:hypothetical protein
VPIPDRLAARYKNALPKAARPSVLRIFDAEEFDEAIEVTSFVWGLDRQFMNRSIDRARLVYCSANQQTQGPIALGHHFQAPGIRFDIDLRPGTIVGAFLDSISMHQDSAVYQALLGHVLHHFLSEHARARLNQDDHPWAEQARPSTFMVRNIRTLVWFHLLEQWHPTDTRVCPANPPHFKLDDLIGCFTPGHPRYFDFNRYMKVCRWVARLQNPASVEDRADTLRETRPFFDEACRHVTEFDSEFLRRSAERILLNSLGIALHNAALRVSGASSEELTYFYHHREDSVSSIVLFDSDELGNGTADLLRRNFHVSAVERVLASREAALGGAPDPLPTTDFVECIEEALEECSSCHASHLAFHDVDATPGCWRDLSSACRGERQVAGRLFDFMRTELNITSYDDLALLQWAPEFVAYAAQYRIHSSANLMGSSSYPTFQALESAFGFCVDGCIACLVAPEQNLHGVLNAKESVSKLLLDALYREVVCGATDPVTQLTYPGTGPARTVEWTQLAATVASGLGLTPAGAESFVVTLHGSAGPSEVTVLPATTPGGWSPVFRSGWAATQTPEPIVRPRMPL